MTILSLKRQIEDLKRFEQIIKVFFMHGFDHYIKGLNLSRKLPFHKRVISPPEKQKYSKAERLRMAFEELGGAFIKFGQLLSIRPDLIPNEYCDEFKKLQDSVKAEKYENIEPIIETDFSKPINKIFLKFNKRPLAAASIGQVHLATLNTGEKVVVKIKRPNVDKLFETDIDIILYIAKLIEKRFQPKLVKPVEIVNEFKRYTQDELDFRNEAKNMEKFGNKFRESTKVIIPTVYRDYVSDNVLVSEYIDGIKIGDIELLKKQKYNRTKILHNLVESIFTQIFSYGIFHADPHPGNIMVLKGNKIVFLDFGIVGHMTESMREKITMLFISFLDRDLDGIADGVIDLGFSSGKDFNKEMFKQDLVDRLSRYYDIQLKDVKIGKAFNDIINVARENGIILPSNFVLLLKSIVTLEGLGEQLDSKFNIVRFAKPVIKDFLKKEFSVASVKTNFFRKFRRIKHLMTVLPEQTATFISKLNRGDFKIEFEHKDLESLIYEMEKTSNKIVIGLIVASLLVGSAMALSLEVSTIKGIPYPAFIGFFAAGVLSMFLIRLMIRRV